MTDLALAIVQFMADSLAVGVIVCVCALISLSALRRANAATRYIIAFAALAVTIVLPLTLVLLGWPGPAHSVTAALRPPANAGPGISHVSLSSATLITIAATWCAIVGALAVRLVLGVLSIRQLAARSLLDPYLGALLDEVAKVDRPRIGRSDAIETPLAIGFGAATIVLPAAMVKQTEEEELRQIALHEAAHLRRRDDLTLLAQRLIQAVLFFNPAVHILAERANLERELACDDWVVETTKAPARYARCLVRLASTFSRKARPLLAVGAWLSPKQMLRRVERLAFSHDARTRMSSSAAAAAAMTLIIFGGLAGAATPRIDAGAATAGPVATHTSSARLAHGARPLGRTISAGHRASAVTTTVAQRARKRPCPYTRRT